MNISLLDYLKRCTSNVQTSDSAVEFIGTESKHQQADICLLQESPYRILRVAESGNVKEFERIVSGDAEKLYVRDSRGRAAVHQATVRNHVKILQVIVAFEGDLDLQDFYGNTALHLAINSEALEALEYLILSGARGTILNEKLQTPIHLACELDKSEALSIIARFRGSYDPDQPSQHGRTALHIAAIQDHAECMRILLYEMGACPRRTDRHGYFAIHESAKHASSRSMEILLAWGEEHGLPREEMISFFDAEGNVPLHSAVHGGDIRAVELCLRSGAKISTQQHDLSTPVHLACSQGAFKMVELMFTMQPQEAENSFKSCDLQRMTPLHCAAIFDHYALVDFLITQGAHLNSLNKDRRTPLHLAATRNAWKTMKTLIRLGADISLKDKDSRNVLHVLIIHNGDMEKMLDHEIATLFIPILEDQDKIGNTPLHYAAKKGQIKSVEKLLTLGANIFAKNHDGENVFHLACRYGRFHIVQQILQNEQTNSIVNEADGRGRTPLHIAAKEGHLRVVQILLKKGALLHRDHDGRNPLHLAAQSGHRDAMKLILSIHSHLLDQIDKDGNTPLHVATIENQPNAVELLLKLECHLLYNFNGFSAIDFALQSKHTEVVNVMVTHPTRGDEILNLTSGKYPSIMMALVATMPCVAAEVLNRCIVHSEKSDSEFYHVKYDFKWLSLQAGPVEDSKVKSSKDEYRTTGKLPPQHQKHLPILNMKWNAYGKYFQLANLVLYLLYLVILTAFATSSYNKDSHQYNNDGVLISTHVQELVQNCSQQKYEMLEKQCVIRSISDWETFLCILIVSVSFFNIAREIINIVRHRAMYTFNFENGVWWAMNISSICMVLMPRIMDRPIQNPSASLSAFLCWFYLLVFLQRFDIVGIYVVMFLEILYTLLRVLMIFSILIVAFGLAFYILLSNGKHIAFENFRLSLLRTFSMMLGDLDFMNSFLYPHYCYRQEAGAGYVRNQSSTLGECKYPQRLPHPDMSFLMLGLYMLLMPILLMNLLIGLAVGDIESVRQNAQLKRLTMQVELHTSLEKSLPEFILRRVDKKEIVEYPNAYQAQLGILNWDRVFKYFQPKTSAKDERRSSKPMEDVINSVKDVKTAINVLAYDVDSLKTLIPLVRQICSKMEISTDHDFIDEGSRVEEANLMSDLGGRFLRGVTIRRTKRLPPQRSDSEVLY